MFFQHCKYDLMIAKFIAFVMVTKKPAISERGLNFSLKIICFTCRELGVADGTTIFLPKISAQNNLEPPLWR